MKRQETQDQDSIPEVVFSPIVESLLAGPSPAQNEVWDSADE